MLFSLLNFPHLCQNSPHNLPDRILDFVVIGVQKSATTWLNDCLQLHPDLNVKRYKNEEYYFGGPEHIRRGDDWYWSMFEDNNLPKGCISVDYFSDPDMPARLLELNPEIKIIVSLREPVSRSISAFYWYLRKSMIPNNSLNESMARAIEDYHEQINSPFSELIGNSLYAKNLLRYLSQVPKDRFHLVFFEEIKHDPLHALKELFSFLAIDTGFVPSTMGTIPKKNTYNKFLIYFQRLSSSKVMGKIADILNQSYSSITKGSNGPVLNEEFEKSLSQIFRKDREELANLSEQFGLSKLDMIHDLWG